MLKIVRRVAGKWPYERREPEMGDKKVLYVYLLFDRFTFSPSALITLIKCRLKECEEKLLCD